MNGSQFCSEWVNMTEACKFCFPQDFLRNGGTLESLKALYAIEAKRHPAHANLVQLKYSQIDSPMASQLVQQCRGIILDEQDNWRIIARPFDKFFNHGEPNAAKLHWSTVEAQEKLDGSLCILYWYQGDWRVATSGMPDAGGAVGSDPEYSFNQMFWWLWHVLGYVKPGQKWADHTFMFELITPYNRVVCRYGENRIVFLGAREINDPWYELAPAEFPWQSYKWKAVQTFKLNTLDACMDSFQTMDPLKQEGYVLVDHEFNRLKVKHPGYVALHHLRGNGYGPKRILEVIRAGETKEILTAFPEWTQDFDRMAHRYASLIGELEADYEKIKDIPLQKAFALEAVKSKYSSVLFSVRNQKVDSIREAIKRMNLESLLILLGARGSEDLADRFLGRTG